MSEEYAGLGDSFRRSLLSEGRIIFSGCGATGRLAILLETSWSRACRMFPAARHMEDRVISIMTGGDYALLRSVESFEDYMSFGRRQAGDSAPGPGDTFVAISEGRRLHRLSARRFSRHPSARMCFLPSITLRKLFAKKF